MKKKGNKLPFLFLSIFLVFLLSCEQEEETKELLYKVYIDNPTNKKFVVFINGQKNNIRANSNEPYELEKGEYHFKALNDQNKEVFEKNIKVDTSILINISLQNYYLVNEIFSDDKEIYKKIALDTIELNGQTLIGLFEKMKEKNFFYKKNWNYDLDEEMPKTLPFNGDYKLYSKIVREKDLFKYYSK